MCRICNICYKKTRLPKIPVIHPSKVDFPISNIKFKLINLASLVIDKENLSEDYINYIELMDLERRISHEDILSTIEGIIKIITKQTKEKVTPGMRLKQILSVLKSVIINHIEYTRSNTDIIPQYHIRIQILENLLDNILSQYRIAIMIYHSKV